ncbi:hypothetical protein [Streptomyces sp. NPDC053720]
MVLALSPVLTLVLAAALSLSLAVGLSPVLTLVLAAALCPA